MGYRWVSFVLYGIWGVLGEHLGGVQGGEIF